MDVYEWADTSFNTCPRYETGFAQLLSSKPYRVSACVRRQYDDRYSAIRSFQQTSLEIFRAALKNEAEPVILHWLMNETPDCMGIRYHLNLEDRHFTLPVFFRTDEVKPGKIIEINCPAALWGEFQIVFEHMQRIGYRVGDVSPSDRYVAQLLEYLETQPIVHQLLDKATSPSCSRYFIEKTRPRLKYWSIDRNIKPSDCNFIRHQTFSSLWADDFLHFRLSKTGYGIAYDCPPYVLFDQKATLTLPFWSITSKYFSDQIRDLFPYTTPLLPSGIELPDGTCISIEDFCRWSRSKRAYYLKLAGYNSELNFGSKAVYRLSNLSSEACLAFLKHCLSDFEKGQIWLLQKEDIQDDEVEFFDRDGTIQTKTLRAKFSGFYGPGGCLGVIALHSGHNKVHGQPNTIFSYVINEGDDTTTG